MAGGFAVTVLKQTNDRITRVRRIVLTGFMGAGKSTVGPRLARELGWIFIDLDDEIVREEQRSIADIFLDSGEAYFREAEHRALIAALQRKNIVLALGGGAVESAANRQKLEENPEILSIYLEAPLETLIARCEWQHRSDANAPRRPVLERRAELTERFLRRKPLYETAHWTVATQDLNSEAIVLAILTRWRESIVDQAGRPSR